MEESWAGGPGLPGLLASVPPNPAFALGFLLNPKFPEKVEGRFSAAPLVDLSLSPPSGLDSPNGSSSLSPERQGNGDLPTVPAGPVRGEPRVLETVHLPPGATVTKDHKPHSLKWQQCIILEAEVQSHSADGALRPPKALEGSSRAVSGFWWLQALLALWSCHSSLFSLPLSSHGLLPSVCVSKSPSFSCGDTGHWVYGSQPA